ncbi:MAG: hypothetical protein FJ280_14640 [Planctomycetes bacterium]|nr:hypothetical protein [Planctomycetota bacterium]
MSLLLPAGGCTGLRRAERASVQVPPGDERPPADATWTGTKAEAGHPCLERHGFTILTFRAIRDSFEQVAVIGEIKNVGPAARGVELQAALRDTRGRIVAVGHFFPASCRSIVPDEAWPFTYAFGRQEEAVEAELRIVGAFRTMEVLNAASTTP